MIKVFGKTDKVFTSNGDAVILPVKAKVHNEDNGEFYLDLSAPIKYADYLQTDRIIVAPTPQGEQAFRIDNPTLTGTKIETKAYHVFYDSNNYLIADSFVENKTCDQALNWLNNATEPTSEFTVSSDITSLNSYRCVRESLNTAIMTVLDRWGGHLVRDNFDIQVKQSIGADHGITVRYAKNLTDITVEENWDDVVTKLLPVGKDGILLNALDASVSIYLTSSTQYDTPYTKTVSFEQDINQEDYPTETAYKSALLADLRTQGTAYLQVNCLPKVNYTLKAHIDRTVDIGDTIQVIDDRLGLDLLTDVISYEYDCLTGRYTELEFGNFRKSLSGLIPNITKDVSKGVDSQIQSATSGLQDEITTNTQQIQDIESAIELLSYNQLGDKPSINGVTLSGNKTGADLGLTGNGEVLFSDSSGWTPSTSSGTTVSGNISKYSQVEVHLSDGSFGICNLSWDDGVGVILGMLSYPYNEYIYVNSINFRLNASGSNYTLIVPSAAQMPANYRIGTSVLKVTSVRKLTKIIGLVLL